MEKCRLAISPSFPFVKTEERRPAENVKIVFSSAKILKSTVAGWIPSFFSSWISSAGIPAISAINEQNRETLFLKFYATNMPDIDDLCINHPSIHEMVQKPKTHAGLI